MDDCSFKSQDIGQLLLQFIQTHLREKKEGFNSFGRTTLFEINKTQERGIEVSLQFRSRGSKKTTSSRIQIEVLLQRFEKNMQKKSPQTFKYLVFSQKNLCLFDDSTYHIQFLDLQNKCHLYLISTYFDTYIGNRETFPNIQCLLYFYLYSQSLPIKYKLINSHIALVSSSEVTLVVLVLFEQDDLAKSVFFARVPPQSHHIVQVLLSWGLSRR